MQLRIGLRTAFSVRPFGSPAIITGAAIQVIQGLLRDVVPRLGFRRNDSFSGWKDEGVYRVGSDCFPVSLVVFICRCTAIQGVLQETTDSACSRHLVNLVRDSRVDRVRSADCDEL